MRLKKKIFGKRNPSEYRKYIRTKRHLLTAILASVFISLLRIDEDNKGRK